MSEIRARSVGFGRDVGTIAARAVRLLPRDLEGVVPPLIAAVFVLVVTIGSLQDLAGFADIGIDYKEFQLPTAVVFGVTGMSRAYALVLDIQGGYFDRLLLTPIRRPSLLLGLMAADVVAVILLAIPVTALGLILGVRFETGLIGMAVFLLYGAAWGLAFAGFPYAIALKTGNPAAVNSSFLLFFPFAFLTSTFLPEPALTGWLATIATYNPVTYVLRGLRSLVSEGWVWRDLAQGLGAIGAVGAVSFGLASTSLRGRIAQR